MLQAFISALNSVTAEDVVSRDIVIEEAIRLLNMVSLYNVKFLAENIST